MNLDLCKHWGVSAFLDQEEWNELYDQKLFELKKLVLEQIYLPKLVKKRLDECRLIIRIQSPEKHFMALSQFHFQDFTIFEREMSSVKLSIHQSMDFEDLLLGIHQALSILEAYRELIERYTNQWGEDWKGVEVNSREVFPSGLFLQSLKEGKTINDWKETLLKERKRITIVF